MKESAVPGRSAADPYGTIPSPIAEPETPELAETVSIPGGLPKVIDRYRIERVLGKGGFGLVYLAHDDQLQRLVAIKVPHRKLVDLPEDAEAYLTEARTVASLDHPHIVPVFDVGGTEQFPCFVVSKYIDGTDLATRLKQSRLSIKETTELIATIAEALHYAHRKGLVHRDIKPANILIETDNKPYVADFGLALKEEDFGRGASFAGTPAYMSPEQARGEGHRVDGRSDIFSLGVVFYELLTGRRPFKADSQAELLDQISSVEARPPRQVDDTIPKELERICLKTLSKRASERYTTAKDLADDLRHFFAQATDAEKSTLSVKPASDTAAVPTPVPTGTAIAPSDSRPIKIVPKGLRSFDAHDADFFLELLPGPRDRDGLPDSLRFWKTRIEEKDADNSFSVGLIYGPSGCGKSSLVKAGLLPRLSDDVIPVYVEATAEETETRLLNSLRKRCLSLPDNLSLKETLAALRRGQGIPAGKKVLIVLDQFEQWLHAKKEEQNTELVQALRQCDGQHVQCIVMVRDDFWMAATRFMRELEVRLVEAQNSAAVDLFPIRHAEKVLTAFGRAFGTLTDAATDASQEQKLFLEQSVAGLAQEGKVISVRLALFAEMMKGKAWTPATLKEVGGTEGVGVTFLEETFSTSTAPPEHRFHQKAARGVLKALLPESGSDIKGHMRSYAELLKASGYGSRPNDFEDLIRILDGEIRLITPTDPEGKEGAEESMSQAQPGQKYYQLTHDYLVPSLRDWLTRKQRETRKGRAELRLAERSVTWNSKPERRYLPSLWEYLNIVGLTPRKNWTPPQKKMMAKAGRFHGLWAAGVSLLLVIATVSGLTIRQKIIEQQNLTRAQGLVDALVNADIGQVPAVVRDLTDYRQWADPLLRRENEQAAMYSRQKLHTALALLPVDESQLAYLRDQLPVVSPSQFPVVRDALLPQREQLVEPLWKVALDEKQSIQPRFQAACALATYAPEDKRWDKVNQFVAEHLVTRQAADLVAWREALRIAKHKLADSLSKIFRDTTQRETPRLNATETLADYVSDQPLNLAGLILDSDAQQFAIIFPKLKNCGKQGLPMLVREIDRKLPLDAKNAAKDELAKRQANAAVALLRMGCPERVWPLLKHSPDPSLRSYLINGMYPLGVDARTIINQLGDEADLTIRRALLLSLGEYGEKDLTPDAWKSLLPKLQEIYLTASDPGLHAAAEWLLRRRKEITWLKQINDNWSKDKVMRERKIAEIQHLLAREKEKAPPQWYVTGQGQTMVVIPGPVEFLMGSPLTEPVRYDGEVQHKRRIGRTFALGDKAVTIEEFQRFEKDYRFSEHYSPTSDCPANTIVWYQAAMYCNWLSKEEGIPEDQWCCQNDGRKLKHNYLSLSGYRLPTEAEVEYATRAGALTSRYYGQADDLLSKYAWHLENSKDRIWPVGSLKPNDLGYFDLHGNTYTWCLEGYRDYPPIKKEEPVEDREDELAIDVARSRMLRGGSYSNPPASVRAAYRANVSPWFRTYAYGFRVARTLPPVLPTPLPPPAEGGRN